MDAIRRRFWIDEGIKFHSGLAVRRKTHYLPFIAVAMKSKIFCEFAIKETDGVWKWDGEDMFQASLVSVPDGSGLPGTAAVHYHDGGFVEARKGVGTDRVSEMVIDEAHTSRRLAEDSAKGCGSRFLVPHAGKVTGGVKDVEVGDGPATSQVQSEVVSVNGTGLLPSETYLVKLGGLNACKIEASLDGQAWEASIMLEAAKTLFCDSEEDLAIAGDARGRVVHLGVVDP